jgi:O-antigen/teichoic acid export membrane protein
MGRAASGAAWSIAGHAVSVGLRVLGMVALSRMLDPAAFGLMLIVAAILTGLELFSDLGLKPVVVRSARGDDPEFLATVFTAQAIRGGILAGACALLAWPVSAFYGHAELLPMLAVATVAPLAHGITSVNAFLAARNLQLRPLTAVDVAAQGAGLAVTLVWAAVSPSAWALLLGSLAGSLARLVLSHALLPGPRGRLRWERRSVDEILAFGKWVFISTGFTYVANEGDRLLFGKLITLEQLGVYSIALQAALLPAVVMRRVIDDVLFPLTSHAHQGRGELQAAFDHYRGPVLAGGACVAAAMVACGPDLIRLVFDPRYVEAGWMLQLLSAVIWFRVLDGANTAALLALGDARAVAFGHVAKVAALALLVPLGFAIGGLFGAIVGIASSEAPRYAMTAAGLRRRGVSGLPLDARYAAGAFASGLAAWVALDTLLPDAAAIVRFLTGGIAVALLWSSALWRVARLLLGERARGVPG